MAEQFAVNKLEAHMLREGEAFPPIPHFTNIPRPMNYRILVYPREIATESRGGLVIPGDTVESMRYLRSVGCIVATGPRVFEHESLQEDRPPLVGNWVWVPRYAGEYMEVMGSLDGQLKQYQLKMVRDVDILGIFEGGLRDVMGL